MRDPTNHQRSLSDALRALAEEDSQEGASVNVQALLLAEVRSLARARQRTQMKLYAIAAVLVVSVSVPVWQLARRLPIATAVTDSADPGTDAMTEFFPLTFSNVPVTGGQLIRLEVSRGALDSFGITPADSAGSRPDTVLADVLVGEDGLARAVRFVRPQSMAPQELPQ